MCFPLKLAKHYGSGGSLELLEVDSHFFFFFEVSNVLAAHPPLAVLVPYSPGWKEHRRFVLSTLRNIGDPQSIFHHASANTICQIVFAKHFNNVDEFMKFFTSIFRETCKSINAELLAC